MNKGYNYEKKTPVNIYSSTLGWDQNPGIFSLLLGSESVSPWSLRAGERKRGLFPSQPLSGGPPAGLQPLQAPTPPYGPLKLKLQGPSLMMVLGIQVCGGGKA